MCGFDVYSLGRMLFLMCCVASFQAILSPQCIFNLILVLVYTVLKLLGGFLFLVFLLFKNYTPATLSCTDIN